MKAQRKPLIKPVSPAKKINLKSCFFFLFSFFLYSQLQSRRDPRRRLRSLVWSPACGGGTHHHAEEKRRGAHCFQLSAFCKTAHCCGHTSASSQCLVPRRHNIADVACRLSVCTRRSQFASLLRVQSCALCASLQSAIRDSSKLDSGFGLLQLAVRVLASARKCCCALDDILLPMTRGA
jgi:hypothetical protein